MVVASGGLAWLARRHAYRSSAARPVAEVSQRYPVVSRKGKPPSSAWLPPPLLLLRRSSTRRIRETHNFEVWSAAPAAPLRTRGGGVGVMACTPSRRCPTSTDRITCSWGFGPAQERTSAESEYGGLARRRPRRSRLARRCRAPSGLDGRDREDPRFSAKDLVFRPPS